MENVVKLSQVDFLPHVVINSSRVGRNLEFLGNRYDDALSLPRDAKVNWAFKPCPALPQHLRLSFHGTPAGVFGLRFTPESSSFDNRADL